MFYVPNTGQFIAVKLYMNKINKINKNDFFFFFINYNITNITIIYKNKNKCSAIVV